MQEEQSSFVWKNLIYNTISDVLQKWQIILLVGVVCAICYDAFVSFRYVPMYRSDATVAMDYLTASYDSSKADEIAETFTYILSSNVFKKNIEKSMGVESIDGYFEAKSYQGTSILYVSAYSPKASTSYAMMRAMMDNCEDILKLIVGNNEVEVLSGISLPMAPYNSLSHKRNLVVAGGAGVAVMTMLFAMLSFMKDTLKNKYEVEQKIHLPLYGALPIESKLISFKNLKRKKLFW